LSTYADSSFFVSLYVSDRHSQEVKSRIARHPQLWFTPLHLAEWTHAIEQHVFRGAMSTATARQTYQDFERDREAGLWLEVDLPEEAIVNCVDLARKYVSRTGTRTLDTLHVAAAIELGAKDFWTFDERQAKLAKAAGLKIS
jgi:predicted nucleic acid-binding protein